MDSNKQKKNEMMQRAIIITISHCSQLPYDWSKMKCENKSKAAFLPFLFVNSRKPLLAVCSEIFCSQPPPKYIKTTVQQQQQQRNEWREQRQQPQITKHLAEPLSAGTAICISAYIFIYVYTLNCLPIFFLF